MRLQGKIALVTGGARGIGFAIAKALAAEGAVPVIADINEAGARDALAKLDRQDGLAVGVNVAEQASVEAMVRAIPGHYGRLDVLVNNAGIGGNTPFLDITFEEWNRTIAITSLAPSSSRSPTCTGAGCGRWFRQSTKRSSTSPGSASETRSAGGWAGSWWR